MIAVGDPAPDFTLPDQDGNDVSLSDFRGSRVLLVIFPQDFSPVCTDQMTVYQEVLPQIEAKGAKVLGISIDHSFAHKAFQEKIGISFPLLSDFEPKGRVLRSLGAYLEKWGHGNRSLVLVDAEGKVEWVHAEATPLTIPGANLIFDALG